MKIKKLATGLYGTEDGKWFIVKDGYEPLRDEENRYTTTYDNLVIAPEEVAWVVVENDPVNGTNATIEDTLRAAKAFIQRQY